MSFTVPRKPPVAQHSCTTTSYAVESTLSCTVSPSLISSSWRIDVVLPNLVWRIPRSCGRCVNIALSAVVGTNATLSAAALYMGRAVG